MCGILKTKDANRKRSLLHRGPIPSMIRHGSFNLIHTRLPLQGDHPQPLMIKDKKFLIYYVGEIFNFDKNKYSSDVEYLRDLFESATLYEICEKHINTWDGFWAIMIEDAMTGYTICFTDPLGKKQLYYNTEGEISSEIKPLIKTGYKWDRTYRAHVEKFGYSISDRTPWSGIKRVPPGKVYIFKDEILKQIKEYRFNWDLESKKSLHEMLIESMVSRSEGGHYGGMLVSGGLDSSILAAISKKIGYDFKYYTTDNNELEYVKILADHLSIKVEQLSHSTPLSLTEVLFRNEQPVDLGSLIPQQIMLDQLEGLHNVVITGDGADELFGGYKRSERYDSQESDIFEELPYYHLPRLDRASMSNTIELRNPFLSHDIVRYALSLPREKRIGKNILKETFGHLLPPEILNRDKKALKSSTLLADKGKHQKKIIDTFYGLKWT